MNIEVLARSCLVTDADNCSQLRVLTALSDARDIGAALQQSGIGYLDGEGTHALLDVGRLRSQARAVATAVDWDERWTAMITYADENSWLSVDRRFVQAHIVTIV